MPCQILPIGNSYTWKTILSEAASRRCFNPDIIKSEFIVFFQNKFKILGGFYFFENVALYSFHKSFCLFPLPGADFLQLVLADI